MQTLPSAVGGLEGVEKRVGSRGKKESKGLNVVPEVISVRKQSTILRVRLV